MVPFWDTWLVPMGYSLQESVMNPMVLASTIYIYIFLYPMVHPARLFTTKYNLSKIREENIRCLLASNLLMFYVNSVSLTWHYFITQVCSPNIFSLTTKEIHYSLPTRNLKPRDRERCVMPWNECKLHYFSKLFLKHFIGNPGQTVPSFQNDCHFY